MNIETTFLTVFDLSVVNLILIQMFCFVIFL